LRAVRGAPAGSTIALADGVYRLPRGRSIEITVPGLTIRSASGRREAVRIEGGAIGIAINADNVTIADLTLSGARFHAIQVRGERRVSGTRIYNVHALDSGQQIIKVSAGDGARGESAGDGEIACSLLEYSDYNRGAGMTPGSYTNAIDILAARGWVVRDNRIRRIRSREGPAGPAILVWRAARDTRIVRNVIVDSWRGIALGLARPNAGSRGGAAVGYDHRDGVVENNVVLALTEPADAAIESNFAVGSRIEHNTVYYAPGLAHAVGWSIEYRFEPTTAVIRNNLTNRPIVRRRPVPRRPALLAGNLTTARAGWFRDIAGGDFHLVPGAPAVDAGVADTEVTADIDGELRPQGAAPDPGADELVRGAGR